MVSSSEDKPLGQEGPTLVQTAVKYLERDLCCAEPWFISTLRQRPGTCGESVSVANEVHLFHRNEVEVKNPSGMAGLGSLCDTAINLTLTDVCKEKNIANKKDLSVYLQTQILDPGDAGEAGGTPAEHITILWANMNENV